MLIGFLLVTKLLWGHAIVADARWGWNLKKQLIECLAYFNYLKFKAVGLDASLATIAKDRRLNNPSFGVGCRIAFGIPYEKQATRKASRHASKPRVYS